MSDLAAEHQPIDSGAGVVCHACRQPWGDKGCDTVIVLARLHEQASSWQSSWDALYSDCAAAKARLHEVEAERDELGDMKASLMRQRDAALAIGAKEANEDFIQAARLNHGERGHPEPWDECRREVCTWVRFIHDERVKP